MCSVNKLDGTVYSTGGLPNKQEEINIGLNIFIGKNERLILCDVMLIITLFINENLYDARTTVYIQRIN